VVQVRGVAVGHSAARRLLIVSFTDGAIEHASSALDKRLFVSDRIMKKTRRHRRRASGELRKEYRFDYSTAKPNRYASRLQQPVVAVVLDPDVAAIFDSATKVNAHLRAALSTGSPQKQPARVRPPRRKTG
jgi:hypothetical protein